MLLANIINLILICICYLLAGLSYSLLSPFYPTVALAKGVTMTQSGLVFGSIHITTVILTPLCGKYYHLAGGAKIFFFCGSFVCALGNICFGFLYRIDSSSVFLALSFIIRIFTAIGEAAIGSYAFTLAAHQGTKDEKGKLISIAEASFGVGQLFSPSVGGFLYEIGGFGVPFWICGGILLVPTLAAIFLYKDVSEDECQTSDLPRSIGWCQLFCVGAVPVSVFSLFMASSSFYWYNVSLSPFLSSQYSLSAAQCGLFFTIYGLGYTLFTPLFGCLMDRGLDGLTALAIGNLCITVGFIFMGPIPQLEVLSENSFLTGLSLGVQGLGSACTYVGALVYMSTSATNAGLPDSEQFQGMVSSLWMVSGRLGGYLGATMGAMASDKLGFREGTLIESSLMVVSVLVLLVVKVWRGCGSRMKGEYPQDVGKEDVELKKLLLDE